MASRRERYERANMRGGMGVRKRLSEDSLRTSYRLNGVQTGSAVARCLDRYGRWEYGHVFGIIVRKTAQTVYIRWLGEEDISHYSQGDARYEVERGRWKILGVLRGDPLNPDNPLVDALTELQRSYKVEVSANADDPTPPTEENDDMAGKSQAAHEREEAQRALAKGDLKDRETYTAKQVAFRCGTDAKTMRKFFRSAHSTVEPVGQGGRYDFAAKDFPKIKKEFDAWQKRAAARSTRGSLDTPARRALQEQIKTVKGQHKSTAKKAAAEDDDFSEAEIEAALDDQADQEEANLDRWGDSVEREPSPEELEEQDDLDLDLDDLDAKDE